MSLSDNPSRRQSTVSLRLARGCRRRSALGRRGLDRLRGGAGTGRLCSADRSPLRQRDRPNQCRSSSGPPRRLRTGPDQPGQLVSRRGAGPGKDAWQKT